MGQKLSFKFLFIFSPNTDGFYRFYISQGSVATQLVTIITNFQQNAPVKKLTIGLYFAKIWTQVCGLLFGPSCRFGIRWTSREITKRLRKWNWKVTSDRT